MKRRDKILNIWLVIVGSYPIIRWIFNRFESGILIGMFGVILEVVTLVAFWFIVIKVMFFIWDRLPKGKRSVR